MFNRRQKINLETRGRIHWIDKNSNIFYKIYKKDNLLDDSNTIKTRLNKIVELTDIIKFMPTTSYFYEEGLLVMKQRKLTRDKRLKEIDPIERFSLIEYFSQSLDRLYREGFVHGDINRKNIIYSSGRLCLIDLEPSLLQVKDRVKQWMSTRPYRYSEDINNNNITIKSDFLGFGCFVKWFLGSSHPPQFYATRCSEMIKRLEINSKPFQTLVPLLIELSNLYLYI